MITAIVSPFAMTPTIKNTIINVADIAIPISSNGRAYLNQTTDIIVDYIVFM